MMELPLFPLKTVLFPGCPLDLQVFEPRYLDMLSRTLKAGEHFGIVTLLEGSEVGEAAHSLACIGCEALIQDWQRQPNGLLGIRVQGGRRFSIQQTKLQPDQLTIAQIDWLTELEDQAPDAKHADLTDLLTQLKEHPLVQSLEMHTPVTTQAQLANYLAYLLPLTNTDKLELLQLNSPTERLDLLQQLLERIQHNPETD